MLSYLLTAVLFEFPLARAVSELGREYRKFDVDFERHLHPHIRDLMRLTYNISADELRQLYFGDERITRENKEKLVDLLGDVYFVEGIHRVVKARVEKSPSQTYLYRYAYDRGFSFMKTLSRSRVKGKIMRHCFRGFRGFRGQRIVQSHQHSISSYLPSRSCAR